MKKLSLFILLLHITSITHAMSDAAEVPQEQSTDDLIKTLRNLHGDHNWENRKNVIVQLIKKDPSNVDVIGYNDYTPLGESSAFCDISFAHWLLQHNADVNKEYEFHLFPLSEAAIRYSLAVEFEKPINPKKIARHENLIRLLFFYNADTDLGSLMTYDKVRTFVKRVKREKELREYLFVIAHITQDPAFIVANYLKEDFQQPTIKELTEIEAQVDDVLPI